MKQFKTVAASLLMVACASVMAQTYPYSNPTYLPTAVAAPATYSAPADYTFQTNGLNVATVRITGTCTSLAGTVQGTNDGTNWTDLPIASVAGGASTVAISSTGFWKADTSGFTKVRTHITALTASCTVAMAGTNTGTPIADVCQNPAIAKSSAAIAQGASATTKLVEAVTGKAIYVCSFVASATGTTPTMTFKYGTKVSTDCDTGATALSGAIVPTATTGTIQYEPGTTAFATPVSKQLCLTTAATTDVQGILTYVQQ